VSAVKDRPVPGVMSPAELASLALRVLRIPPATPLPAAYIPPLSPVVDALTTTGHDGEDADNLFGAIDTLRIPIGYLAELFTAGDPAPVRDVLARLAAMRSYMRRINLGQERDESIAAAVGMTGEQIERMHRLLAIAPYGDRYVIPKAHAEQGARLEELGTGCSLDYEGGPGMGGPFGEASGLPAPVAVETFHGLKDRQTTETLAAPVGPEDASDLRGRINLLNWDGKGLPDGLFPKRKTDS
jgi:nitrate reductase beta subunit